MTPEYTEAVWAWIAKAKSDLASARLLIEGNEPHLDTPILTISRLPRG
jgi:hypothetical protein